MMDNLSLFEPTTLYRLDEKKSLYKPGGYHHVCLGDTFKEGRYKICHKLGWGGCSTVWLAYDSVLKTWVSIKVKMAHGDEVANELETLSNLQKTPASKHIVKQLDDFVHNGPNGSHQCLVFELLGPTLDAVAYDFHDIHDAEDRLEPEAIIRIARQLLEAVASIHAAGYVHGDISGSNLAFCCKGLAQLPQECVSKILGEPKSEGWVRAGDNPVPGGPISLMKTAGWDEWIDEDDEDVRLIGFGQAFAQGSPPDTLFLTPDLRAPEIIFTDHFDYRVDLWCTGLTIFTALFERRPFSTWRPITTIVAQMIEVIEDLPAEWQPQWERMQAASRLTTTRVDDRPALPRLEQKFHDRIKNPDLKPLLAVIQGLMRLRPSDRISAAEALKMISSKEDDGELKFWPVPHL